MTVNEKTLLRKDFFDKKMVGERLRHFRKEFLGKTLEEFSVMADSSPSFLSEIERGEKKLSLDVAYALAKNTGLNIDWLVDGDGNPSLADNVENPNERNGVVNIFERSQRLAINEVAVLREEPSKYKYTRLMALSDELKLMIESAVVEALDKRLLGEFYYSSATHGIYHAPGCELLSGESAKISSEEIRRLGFLPCEKCRPKGH